MLFDNFLSIFFDFFNLLTVAPFKYVLISIHNRLCIHRESARHETSYNIFLMLIKIVIQSKTSRSIILVSELLIIHACFPKIRILILISSKFFCFCIIFFIRNITVTKLIINIRMKYYKSLQKIYAVLD